MLTHLLYGGLSSKWSNCIQLNKFYSILYNKLVKRLKKKIEDIEL